MADNKEIALTESQSMVSTIAQAAIDPNVDVAKLEKLMDLQERFLNREAATAFAADYVLMKPHLPAVLKTRNNTQTKSKYAKLEDVNKVVDPVLAEFGFGTQTKVKEQTDRGVTVTAILTHKAGHKEETTVFIPLDDCGIAGTKNKTGPHAVSSSITYGKRIAICALLNISTDDDTDGNRQETGLDEPISMEQAVAIDILIKETNADKSKFLEFVGAETVPAITNRNHKKALNMLTEKKRRMDEDKKAGV